MLSSFGSEGSRQLPCTSSITGTSLVQPCSLADMQPRTRQVLAMQYHVRVSLHFCRTNLWNPNGPLDIALFAPLQTRGWQFGVVADDSSAYDQAVYEVERIVDPPEYPRGPYCCRSLLSSLISQTDDYCDLSEALHFAVTAPWSLHPDFAGVRGQIFYFPTSTGFGIPLGIDHPIPDFDDTGVATDARLELEVYLSHEWRLWQPLPADFQYTARYDTPDEGADLTTVRDRSHLLHSQDVVHDSYFGW